MHSVEEGYQGLLEAVEPFIYRRLTGFQCRLPGYQVGELCEAMCSACEAERLYRRFVGSCFNQRDDTRVSTPELSGVEIKHDAEFTNQGFELVETLSGVIVMVFI